MPVLPSRVQVQRKSTRGFGWRYAIRRSSSKAAWAEVLRAKVLRLLVIQRQRVCESCGSGPARPDKGVDGARRGVAALRKKPKSIWGKAYISVIAYIDLRLVPWRPLM
jgi:hypothetical protein